LRPHQSRSCDDARKATINNNQVFVASNNKGNQRDMAQAPADESAETQPNPEIKICQTDTLVLISILEPNVSVDDLYVLIEPKHISVDITRHGLVNPLVAGALFGKVEKQHCRVRIKKDSVVIKLRKTFVGRWKSILQQVSPVPAPEAGSLEEVTTEDSRDPIVPRPHHEFQGDNSELTSAMSVDLCEGDEEVETIDASENNVLKTLRDIKKFHMDLFGKLGRSSTAQEEGANNASGDESRHEAESTD
jgi:CS domain